MVSSLSTPTVLWLTIGWIANIQASSSSLDAHLGKLILKWHGLLKFVVVADVTCDNCGRNRHRRSKPGSQHQQQPGSIGKVYLVFAQCKYLLSNPEITLNIYGISIQCLFMLFLFIYSWICWCGCKKQPTTAETKAKTRTMPAWTRISHTTAPWATSYEDKRPSLPELCSRTH